MSQVGHTGHDDGHNDGHTLVTMMVTWWSQTVTLVTITVTWWSHPGHTGYHDGHTLVILVTLVAVMVTPGHIGYTGHSDGHAALAGKGVLINGVKTV